MIVISVFVCFLTMNTSSLLLSFITFQVDQERIGAAENWIDNKHQKKNGSAPQENCVKNEIWGYVPEVSKQKTSRRSCPLTLSILQFPRPFGSLGARIESERINDLYLSKKTVVVPYLIPQSF